MTSFKQAAKHTAALLCAGLLISTSAYAGSSSYKSAEKKQKGSGGYEQQASNTIVDKVEKAGQFATLTAAIKAADLTDALNGDGPFTVFAPTDRAFNLLPSGTVDGLLKASAKEDLATLLKSHVISGKVMAADIKGKMMEVETLSGEMVKIDATGTPKINGTKIIMSDVEADNGIIHIIDAVLSVGDVNS